mmetsp:Transcript_18888/g.72008  ORF Transcript_18888/g.72008 Transcript_18888/m.72008 type:complete len:202 (+) Transcript_18888:333-938(+)
MGWWTRRERRHARAPALRARGSQPACQVRCGYSARPKHTCSSASGRARGARDRWARPAGFAQAEVTRDLSASNCSRTAAGTRSPKLSSVSLCRWRSLSHAALSTVRISSMASGVTSRPDTSRPVLASGTWPTAVVLVRASGASPALQRWKTHSSTRLLEPKPGQTKPPVPFSWRNQLTKNILGRFLPPSAADVPMSSQCWR